MNRLGNVSIKKKKVELKKKHIRSLNAGAIKRPRFLLKRIIIKN